MVVCRNDFRHRRGVRRTRRTPQTSTRRRHARRRHDSRGPFTRVSLEFCPGVCPGSRAFKRRCGGHHGSRQHSIESKIAFPTLISQSVPMPLHGKVIRRHRPDWATRRRQWPGRQTGMCNRSTQRTAAEFGPTRESGHDDGDGRDTVETRRGDRGVGTHQRADHDVADIKSRYPIIAAQRSASARRASRSCDRGAVSICHLLSARST
jgi:hypothetical protein